jgi:hypothetical protein
MRETAFLLTAFAASVAACAKGDAAADTAAAVDSTAPVAAAAAAAPAPQALTAAAIAGEWAGTSYADPGDTVLAKWHIKTKTDSTAVLTFDRTRQSVNYKTTYSGDSLVSVSEPYTAAGAPAGAPKVTFHAIGRLQGDTLRGVTHIMSAAKPDSTIATHRWVATRPK